MQEELKRSNTIGDTKGIAYFTSAVLKDPIHRESARQICSFGNDMRINFNAAVAFFEYLGLVTVSVNHMLIPTEDGKKLYGLMNTSDFRASLCHVCIRKLAAEGLVDISAIRFDTLTGKYHIMKHGFPLSLAVFRNFLIELRALTDRGDGSLELSVAYEPLFGRVQKALKTKLSLESLKKQLEKQETQGEAAELFVVEYEKNRLGKTEASKGVKRISEMDVTAGYDVVSFEGSLSDQYDRFIEVKSFMGNPHFYWSRNEINVARFLNDKYYLYIVDVEKLGKGQYVPLIIQNPAKQVLESDDWLMEPTSYLVVPT